MSNILEKIIETKRHEVIERRELFPTKLLEKELYFSGPVVSLSSYLKRQDLVGVIAEIKRRSPSKGIIREPISVEDISIGYMQARASALSVLTDREYFGGSSADLKIARKCNYAPILRKDFIIDEYQIIEAKAIGADVVLLIAAALTPKECRTLAQQARSLGLEVLLEVHSKAELESHFGEGISLVGVNNRDLKTFNVSIDLSYQLIPEIPKGVVAVAESGISKPEDLVALKKAGFKGFLIGETFMRQGEPQEACARFISKVESLLGAGAQIR
jgi:indole-3-glycerol phosphate synthase